MDEVVYIKDLCDTSQTHEVQLDEKGRGYVEIDGDKWRVSQSGVHIRGVQGRQDVIQIKVERGLKTRWVMVPKPAR